jgi:hypothetical protein
MRAKSELRKEIAALRQSKNAVGAKLENARGNGSPTIGFQTQWSQVDGDLSRAEAQLAELQKNTQAETA